MKPEPGSSRVDSTTRSVGGTRARKRSSQRSASAERSSCRSSIDQHHRLARARRGRDSSGSTTAVRRGTPASAPTRSTSPPRDRARRAHRSTDSQKCCASCSPRSTDTQATRLARGPRTRPTSAAAPSCRCRRARTAGPPAPGPTRDSAPNSALRGTSRRMAGSRSAGTVVARPRRSMTARGFRMPTLTVTEAGGQRAGRRVSRVRAPAQGCLRGRSRTCQDAATGVDASRVGGPLWPRTPYVSSTWLGQALDLEGQHDAHDADRDGPDAGDGDDRGERRAGVGEREHAERDLEQPDEEQQPPVRAGPGARRTRR